MTKVDIELERDAESVAEYEGRPIARSGNRKAGHRPERWRRIAERSQPAVMSHDGYSYAQHSQDRETARRLRQMQR